MLRLIEVESTLPDGRRPSKVPSPHETCWTGDDEAAGFLPALARAVESDVAA